MVHVVTESGVSATRVKDRVGFSEVLDLLRSGKADVVVTTELSRLSRRFTDLGRLLEVLEESGARAVTVSGDLDTSTASGRLIVGVLGTVAAAEAEQTRERTLRGLDAAAAAGRGHGGHRPFGFTMVGGGQREIREAEAEIVREIARRIIDGESLYVLTRDLEARGVAVAAGGRGWTPATIRSCLTNPGVAGLRRHGDRLVPAVWPAILERGVWEDLLRIFNDPSRRTTPGPKPAHLLTGIARCAGCLGLLTARKPGGHRIYTCMNPGCPERAGCPEDRLDEFITSVLIDRLKMPDVIEILSPEIDHEERQHLMLLRDSLLERRDALAKAFADGWTELQAWSLADRALASNIKDAEAQLGSLMSRKTSRTLAVGPDVAERWLSVTLEQRRETIRLLMEPLVGRTRQGRRFFDPGCVTVKWRIGDGS